MGARMTAETSGLFLRRAEKSGENPAPDIWIGGDIPIADAANVLLNNYETEASGTSVTQRRDQYIYIRAKNGGTVPVTNNVAQLYLTEKRNQLYPERWQILHTDSGSNVSLFGRTGAGDVKVAKEVFLLSYNPFWDTSGYCLIAQINDMANQLNPVSSLPSPLDWEAFLKNRLWSVMDCVSVIPVTGFIAKMDTTITTGPEPSAQGYYTLTLTISGCAGTQVQLTASRPDDRGTLIVWDVKVTLDCQTETKTNYYFNPSYYAYVSMYIITDDGSRVAAAVLSLTAAKQAEKAGPNKEDKTWDTNI